MSAIGIILIIIGGLILWGPIMLFFAKINKIDPYMLDKGQEAIEKDEKSFILVNILKPLFVPLWLETDILKRIGLIKK